MSYTLAEQFSDVMELRGLQSAARMGRARGITVVCKIPTEKIDLCLDSCDLIKCSFLDTELRSLTHNRYVDLILYALSWF